MSCVFCTKGCQYCQPDIPEWYSKAIPAKRRTHEQLRAVQSGLHPSGNEEWKADEGESVPRCSTCKFRQLVPGGVKYKWCTKASNEFTRLVTIYMHACEMYEPGDEISGMLWSIDKDDGR